MELPHECITCCNPEIFLTDLCMGLLISPQKHFTTTAHRSIWSIFFPMAILIISFWRGSFGWFITFPPPPPKNVWCCLILFHHTVYLCNCLWETCVYTFIAGLGEPQQLLMVGVVLQQNLRPAHPASPPFQMKSRLNRYGCIFSGSNIDIKRKFH